MKYFDRFIANFNLMRGIRLLKRAARSNVQKATLFSEAAYRRFAIAIESNPELADAHVNWGHGLYNAARKLSGKDRQRGFRNACEQYQNACSIKPNDTDTLKHWGLALRELAQCKREKKTDTLFIEAYEKFSMAASINSSDHDVFYHWGTTLYQQALKKNNNEALELYKAAIEKFSLDSEINDKRPHTFNDWGASLMAIAKIDGTDNSHTLFADALDKFGRAENLKTGFASYNLACISSLMGNFDACHKHLETAKENGKLPITSHLQRDDDLSAARKTDWFKLFIADLD